MLDALIDGLVLVLQWKAFSLMLVGMGVGFVVGLLPGIGGGATLALMIPFIFRMSPVEAFAFLLGMHSVAATTGDITSILFGVPGEALSAATVVDGHPMAPPGTPADRLAVLREALAKALRDPELSAEGAKAQIEFQHISADEVARSFAALMQQPPEVLKE